MIRHLLKTAWILLFLLFGMNDSLAEPSSPEKKIIVILPFQFFGSSPVTREGDINYLVGEALEYELWFRGYPVVDSKRVRTTLDTLDMNVKVARRDNIEKLIQVMDADIFIHGEIIMYSSADINKYALNLNISATDKQNNLLRRESFRTEVTEETQLRDLLRDWSFQFLQRLNIRG